MNNVHDGVNQVYRKRDKWSLWMQARMEWKWLWVRLVKVLSLVSAFWHARRIELLLQEFEQKRNNLDYGKEYEMFHYMKGFCDGIKYCLDGKWYEEKDRNIFTFWRDKLS